MQSGISASPELHAAFNTLVSSPTQRGLLATITGEALHPTSTVPLTSDFRSDLSALSPLLTPTAASYILLKAEAGAPDGYMAITYVPDSAPVRQKMLFASTRLTLVRELGVERFRETLFVTDAAELTAEGWARHEAHGKLDAPLTEEESANKALKEAEAVEAGGTKGRRVGGGALGLGVEQEAITALVDLREGEAEAGRGVMIRIDVQSETLLLESKLESVAPEDLASNISSTEPRYTFYLHPADPSTVLFLYSCPSASKIKERMVYAASRAKILSVAEHDAGLSVTKRLEATEPSDWTADVLQAEFAEHKVESKGFARPKRPGRR